MAITKRQIFEALNTMTFEDVIVGDAIVTDADIKDFIEKSIAQIDARNEKAKERQAQKKAEGDSAGHEIEKLLTSEPQTINDILSQLQTIEGYEDFTSAKIVARLKRLVDLGTVTKSDVKVDNRKVKAYSITTDTEVVE